ncbi:MAG TPA: TetR/AcrR family transcriptional regulator [Kofleriaceae bacterium]
MPKKPEPRLSAADWETAALDALAEDGLAGIAVEALARKLGVTKGSFYWHFADRDALLAAALARWETSYTDNLIAQLGEIRDPRARLARLFALVTSGGRGDRIHIGLANSPHALVRKTLARASHRRIAFLESCYAELGQPKAIARRSALIAYAAYVGLVHLRLEAPGELPASSEELVKLVPGLVPKPRS